MESREPLQQSDGHALPRHQQQRHGDVVVPLVIVQLRVDPQDVQDDVCQLLLQDLPLLLAHACGVGERQGAQSQTSPCATGASALCPPAVSAP